MTLSAEDLSGVCFITVETETLRPCPGLPSTFLLQFSWILFKSGAPGLVADTQLADLISTFSVKNFPFVANTALKA